MSIYGQVSKATGRFWTLCGAILDVQTAVAIQNETEGLDKKFSTLLQDEVVQRLLMRKMIELGIKQADSLFSANRGPNGPCTERAEMLPRYSFLLPRLDMGHTNHLRGP